MCSFHVNSHATLWFVRKKIYCIFWRRKTKIKVNFSRCRYFVPNTWNDKCISPNVWSDCFVCADSVGIKLYLHLFEFVVIAYLITSCGPQCVQTNGNQRWNRVHVHVHLRCLLYFYSRHVTLASFMQIKLWPGLWFRNSTKLKKLFNFSRNQFQSKRFHSIISIAFVCNWMFFILPKILKQ